jgi:ABC-type nitrate/sulfonate/bicarbonate transport system permease component
MLKRLAYLENQLSKSVFDTFMGVGVFVGVAVGFLVGVGIGVEVGVSEGVGELVMRIYVIGRDLGCCGYCMNWG